MRHDNDVEMSPYQSGAPKVRQLSQTTRRQLKAKAFCAFPCIFMAEGDSFCARATDHVITTHRKVLLWHRHWHQHSKFPPMRGEYLDWSGPMRELHPHLSLYVSVYLGSELGVDGVAGTVVAGDCRGARRHKGIWTDKLRILEDLLTRQVICSM